MFIRPALLAHEFARLDQSDQDGGSLPERLLNLWRQFANLAMQTDLADVDVGSKRVQDGGASGRGLEVFAILKRPTQDVDLYQAVLSSAGDAICLTALLAPNSQACTWGDLDKEWPRVATPAPDQDLGGVRIYVAYVDSPLDEDAIGSIAAALGKAVPDAGDGAWTHRWSRTSQDFLLWEPPPRHQNERRLVLIGQRTAERRMDHFSWTSGAQVLGPFIHYLLDAAKLRYKQAVHDASSAQIRRLSIDLDGAVDELLELHRSASTAPAELVTANTALTRLQADSTGLITTLARLRKLAHSVDVATANMSAAVQAVPAASGPLAADQALAKSLRERVGDDIAYLDISRERADRVSALTTTAVQRGLGAFQQQLLLIQASVVGAIVMILAAVQAFDTKIDLPNLLQAPLIAVLGSLALALPTAVLRWSRSVPRDMPLRKVDYLAMFVLGASVGWLGGEVTSYAATQHPLEKSWTWVISFGTGFVLVALAWLRSRQLDRLDRARPLRR
jgi:hypothetical protein